MYLQDHVGDPQEVIAGALASAVVRKSPDIETAMRETAKAVEKAFKANLAAHLEAGLEDLVLGFQLINGDWTADMEATIGIQAKTDYESALDDIVEGFTEPYVDYLSANWLGINTIDSQVWVEGGVGRFAVSMAKEIHKQLTDDKTPGQSLASAGITRDMVEAMLADVQKGKVQVTDTSDIQTTLAKALAFLGKDFDIMQVYEDLDTITGDDDEVLINSAAARLGLGEDDVNAIQIEALNAEDDAAQHVLDMLQLAAAGPAPSRAKNDAKAARNAQKIKGTADALDPSILAALKNNGVGDTAFAEKLGVSRTTYLKYVSGKTPFVADPNQYATIREELVERANALLVSLAALDGTEATEVA